MDKRRFIEIIPPFILTKLDSKAYLPFDPQKLMDIWVKYMSKEFPQAVIEIGDGNLCNNDVIFFLSVSLYYKI